MWRRSGMIDFKGSQFEREIIQWGVRWYVAYPISYRQLEEMMKERGVSVDHATLNHPNISLTFRFTARWSCSTILFRYLHCRRAMEVLWVRLYRVIAAVLLPLWSIVIFSGSPWVRMALWRKASAASRSRLGVSRKSMV